MGSVDRTMSPAASAPHPQPLREKVGSLLYTAFGVASVVVGAAMAIIAIYLLGVVGFSFYEGAFEDQPAGSLALFVVYVILVGITAVGSVLMGIRLLRGKVRGAHVIAEFMTFMLLGAALCELMLDGVSIMFAILAAIAAFLVVVFTVLDPSLRDERRLQRKLRDMETREEAEEGILGRDESGKGYIALNFFNLFWIFVIGAFVGDIVETVYHYMIEVPGEFQVRAGMLWGPLSPIYGFGAVILTLLLNRFYKANVVIIFLVSAIVGGAFEYFVSWFLEFAFGSVAWDYTGRFLNIGGRTDFMFMCMWGVLGVIWVKWMLPGVLDLVNRIPWQWRYTLTAICAALIIFDGAMTLLALDCWYLRLAGSPTDEIALTQFFADHFDNDYMADRFQSMSIHPDLTKRIS